MNKTTKQERFAMIAIVCGILIVGWMDGNDAAMAEKSSAVAQRYSVKHQGQKLACIKCGQP